MTELERARAIIRDHGWNATAYQIVNPGIARWYSARGDAVIGFVRRSGVRVVAGAPVCARERLEDVAHEFHRSARDAGERVCYFGAGDRLHALLAASGGWSVAGLGAQPSWDPRGWPAIIDAYASLRAQLHRARNKRVRVEEWSSDAATNAPALERVLSDWLRARPLPPMHFLVEPHTLSRLGDRRVFVARRDDDVVGYLVASPVPARTGWLIEQIVRGAGAPNGTSELLIDAAMRAVAADGARYATLGLAPLSRHSGFDATRMPRWLRFTLRWVRAHGRRFYDFEGLDRFKAKFRPHAWEEIVALADAPRFPLRAMWAIAGAFSDGSPLTMIARASLKAVHQEIAWLATR